MKKPIIFKVPANLDLENLLTKHPPVNYKGVDAGKLAYICHALITIEVYFGDDKLKNGGFIPLHSQVLLNIMCSYKDCLDYLIETGVIICDELYIRGVVSKGYQFTDSFKGVGFKNYEVQCYTFKKRIRKLKEWKDNENTESCKTAKHLTNFFDPKKLEINREKAFEWIERQQAIELENISAKSVSEGAKEKQKIKLKYKSDLYKLTVDNFCGGEFYCKVDDKGFRFHSALTNIKKELRSFITYEECDLISLDIKNCQPFLVLLLFKESFYKKSRIKSELTLNSLFPELFEYLYAKGYVSQLKKICRLTTGLKRTLLDFDKYKYEVVNAIFYDSFLDKVNNDTRIKYKKDRQSIKTETLTVMFSEDSFWAQSRYVISVFRHFYPSVYKMISIFKKRKYQDFAWLLQRIESRLVLNVISKEFNELHPTAPVFTIHDNIATSEDYIEDLKKIMEKRLLNAVGEKPPIKAEQWKKNI